MNDMAAQKARERRIFPRVDLEVEVGLDTEDNFYTGLTQDISAGGLFIVTQQAARIGERVVIKFSLPGRPAPILAEGEVRWIREQMAVANAGGQGLPVGMGVQFLNLTADEKEAIDGFISQREALFYED